MASAASRPVSALARCTGSTHIRLSTPDWRSIVMPIALPRVPNSADSTAQNGTTP